MGELDVFKMKYDDDECVQTIKTLSENKILFPQQYLDRFDSKIEQMAHALFIYLLIYIYSRL